MHSLVAFWCLVQAALLCLPVAKTASALGESSKILAIQDSNELQKSDEHDIPKGYELKQAIVVFRDAARTPLGDRYLNHSLQWSQCRFTQEGPKLELHEPDGKPVLIKESKHTKKVLPGGCPPGMVTSVGYEQAKSFGSWLRQRYVVKHKLVSSSQQTAEGISIWASSHNRSLVTLQGVVRGLLPDAGSSAAVPVLTSPPKQQIMYADAHACKMLAMMIKNLNQTKHEADDVLETPRDDGSALKAAVALPRQGSKWISWKRLLDATMCLEAHGLPLFPGLDGAHYSLMDKEASVMVSHVLGPKCSGEDADCHGLLKLSIGLLLQQLVSRLQAGAACSGRSCVEDAARLQLFSGHDSTLFPLVAVLDSALEQWPPFMASLVLEVWEDPARPGALEAAQARLLYNFRPLQWDMGAKGAFQPLTKLLEVLQPYTLTPDDYKQRCTHGEHTGPAMNVGQVLGVEARR